MEGPLILISFLFTFFSFALGPGQPARGMRGMRAVRAVRAVRVCESRS